MRAVCRGAGARACWHRRQLLRARRPFAAGDAAGQPDSRQHSDVEIAIRSLFEAPTVEALASSLTRRAGGASGASCRCRGPARSRCRLRSAGCGFSSAGRPERDLQHPDGVAACGGAGPRRAGGGSRRCGGAAREPAHDRSRRRSGCPGSTSWTLRAARPRLEVERSPRRSLPRRSRRRRGSGFDLATRAAAAGASVCAGPRASTCCCCCCTTLPATAGRWRRCGAIWRWPMRRGCRARRRSLPALPVQYADYTLWQHQVLGEESDPREPDSAPARVLDGRRWPDLPEQLDLPTDRPRPAVASHRGDSVPVHIGAAAASRSAGAGPRQPGEPVHGAAGGRWRRC